MDLSTAATGPFSPTEFHARLARLAGRWKGTAKTFADPSNPDAAESAPWEGAIEMILGGRYLRFTYASQAFGQPIAGDLTIAYEKGDRLFRTSWIDSLHTGGAILVSESKPVAEGAVAAPISALGTFLRRRESAALELAHRARRPHERCASDPNVQHRARRRRDPRRGDRADARNDLNDLSAGARRARVRVGLTLDPVSVFALLRRRAVTRTFAAIALRARSRT